MSSDKKKVIVLGSGPIRIGQGIEFDYWVSQTPSFRGLLLNGSCMRLRAKINGSCLRYAISDVGRWVTRAIPRPLLRTTAIATA